MIRLSALRASVLLLLAVPAAFAQTPVAPGTAEILSVSVEGALDESSHALVRSISGLRTGQRVSLPWDPAFGEAVRNLYSRGGYSDAQVVASEVVGDGVFLTITVEEQPRLAAYAVEGMKQADVDELGTQIPLLRGRAVRASDIERTKMILRDRLAQDGYRLASVESRQSIDTDGRVQLTFVVDRGERQAVSDIRFVGNDVFSERTLRKQLSNTPERRWWRFWKTETFDDEKFDQDLTSLVRFYNDRGYYGARVVRDSVYLEPDEAGDERLVVEVEVAEGPKYHIRNVVFEGNTVYTDAQLQLALGIQGGDVYDRTRIEQNLYYSTDHSDLTSLYQDRGYYEFYVAPEVVEAPGDSLDLFLEVTEGEVYEFGEVRIAGNTRTKEHVIRRELRTIPGQPYSRQAIERSVRELATLNYFDPASFGAGPAINVDEDGKTVDLVYNLAETSSDQLELSGGYGGSGIGLILSARVTFANFSVQNLAQGFKGGMPTGDGQQLSLQVQTYGQRAQIYSLSFTEPWFRGQATPAGFSLAYRRQTFNTATGTDGLYSTASASVFYRQRLKFPDDFFVSGSNIGYRLYDVEGLNSNVLPEGLSQEVTFTQSISRNALDNPTFPQNGSSVGLSLSVAPPIGDFIQYHKWDLNTAFYTPIVGRLTASVKTRFGYIGSLTGDPVRFQRYLIGGTPLEASGTSSISRGFGRDLVFLRGYPLEAVGPRLDGDPVGGRILNKYESEIGLVLFQTPQLSLAPYLFADAANTYDGFDDYDPSRLFRSAGFGARIFLPILGLVDLNMGYQIDPYAPLGTSAGDIQDAQPGWRFQFSLGGR
ncbi:outer membrane protein assembly factor BamA [Rubrivirga sp. IMCC43871]|uniref:outer membrane protein assembly factor BamA n=1 Tax=Rubrivirga sp. IMCC43871 TaxID=3391575 RepID=UPI00398FB347